MFKDMEVTIYEEQGIYINNFREKNLIGFKAVNSINILDNYIIVIFINDEYISQRQHLKIQKKSTTL
ncbi:hypothetical protein [Clostridium intestinale]|uniref:Uncharacterized protein n=2 Tax=Clostridium intestinale TaxID=36845 RepID=U2PY10_9CLOT|nr:hypothetical protein [Clostridium intestinale]ERK31370.1 hypothetical protein CINTURNW_1264 [Clostridium intestinale URNW]QLY78457.1 hypothetical protein HZF06_15350 [Clostridium intestinale]